MIDRIKQECINMMIEGYNITDIAKSIDRSRSTIYDWLKNAEFKAELDKAQQCVRYQGNNYILNKYQSYLANIDKIANATDGDMRSILNANMYLCNRIDGTPTQKIEQVGDSNNSNEISKEDLNKELDEFEDDIENAN